MEIGLTVGDSIELIESTPADFSFVEFGLGEATAPEGIDESDVRGAIERSDVALDVHLPFKQVVATPVPEINDAIVAHQRRLLEWAGDLGARKAVLHGTMRNPHDTDQRSTFARQLERIVEVGIDAGVEVVVENVGHQKYGLQLTVLGDIARETDTPVCFDVGHAYMEDGNDGVKRFTKRYGDLVSHLHVHDARSRGDTHIPVGAGEIDYDLLARYMGEFDGTIAVEVFTDDGPLLCDTARRVADQFGFEW